MNTNSFAEMQKTIKQLKQIVDNLNANNSALIDFDLSLEKTRNLYEQLSELKLERLSNKTSGQKIETKPVIVREDVLEDDLSEKIDEEALLLMEQKESLEFIPESKLEEPIKEEPKTEAPEEVKVVEEELEEKNIIEEFVEESIENENVNQTSNLFDTNETIADKFESKTSLNDILANIRSNDDLATQLENRPIKDLKNAIALNDKIWFTRELFDGNNNVYLSTLENINNSKNIEQAIAIVDGFSWDMKESATKRFMELIYRRFVS